MNDNQHLMLIDASGYVHRAYHSGRAIYREDGLPTWATLGFLGMVWRLLGTAEADKPTLVAAVFDAPGATFRHKLYPAYKAHRGERADELTVQLPFMRHAADTLGIRHIEREGFEADDVIATLATTARKAGIFVTIVSQDKDFCQLVRDGEIEIYDPVARTRIREADVETKFGVPAARMIDFQSLRGDDVDGVPGVPHCGNQKAAALVRRFGGLEQVLANSGKCGWPIVSASLKRYADQARLSRKLVTLRKTVPLDWGTGDLRYFKPEPVQKRHLTDFLKLLGAKSWIEPIFGLDPQMSRPVPRLNSDPYEWWTEELSAPGQIIPEMPQCGYYERRIVQGGVYVPCRIWREPEVDLDSSQPTGNDLLMCEVDGKRRDPLSEWASLAMRPVKRSHFEFEQADIAHARKYRPLDPKAHPDKPIDIASLPVPSFKSQPRRRKS